MSRERLIKSVSTTSDAQGRGTFTLGPAEQGYVYEGSVQVPNAPAGALFIATVLTTNWGQWAGPTNYGPIQLYGGEYLTVTATGLNPNTAYVLTIFGVWGSENDFEPVPPGAPMSVVSVETSTLLVNNPAHGAASPITGIRPPSLTRRITVVTAGQTSQSSTWRLRGEQTNAIYGTFEVTANGPQFCAIEPTVDQTYTFEYLAGSGLGFNVFIVASFTNPLVETNQFFPIRVIPFGGQPNQTANPTPALNTPNQAVIAAQGTRTSIVLHHISAFTSGCNGPVSLQFHEQGSSTDVGVMLLLSTGSDELVYPNGGYILTPNTQLQVNTGLATSGFVELSINFSTVGS